ncbi:sensor histidine kinase [Rhodococcus sp. PAMC28707]|uniref:sensor histidine kinase n=1 Tax=unclassified Rhodococcus (in: high G+C Gram-positive bacteria) TaxID=192944 RepID=UPI00109DFD29|nr:MULTISPECIES: histidine kinase [unclassified Rhodococcus (in: high G+C Gram-positive bacteria)]QCB51618.1 sensor histidine kinase [Rhodococcus sp. PAMC28705]QCB60215.1 sensor histidine kinase [Rhodococcus sp. PAMC28707]
MSEPEPQAHDGKDRFWRFGPVFAAAWLIYLVYPIGELLDKPSRFAQFGGIAIVLVFGVVFLAAFWGLRNGHRHDRPLSLTLAWGALVPMLAITAVLSLLLGTTAFGLTIYISVLAVMILPTAQSITLVAAMLAAVELLPRVVPDWEPDSFFGFQLIVSALAAWGITQIFRRNHELAEARQQLADLAIVAERERMGRDVHDILGHSLTVITVKAELAGRLIDLDPARAAVEIAQVEALAREALGDVRSTVSGARRVDIAVELGNARSALDAAGIGADLPADADDVPLRNRELFGWALREGVTNVIRHSGAQRCSVALDRTSIVVSDDGRGMGTDMASEGNGLRGLGERVKAANGTLVLGSGKSGGFRVEVMSQ